MAEEENLTIQSQLTRIASARNQIRLKLGTGGFNLLTDTEIQSAKIERLAEVLEGVVVHPALDVELDPDKLTYQLPAGYYPGGVVSVDMTFDGEGDANFSLYTPADVVPTKNQQIVELPEGYYGFKSVTVEPIPAAYQDVTGVTAEQAQVLTGAYYVNSIGELKEGTMTNNGAVTSVVSVATPEFTIPQGYHDGTGKVSIEAQTKEFTPDVVGTTITPDTGKVLSAVTIAPIPSQYKDTTDITVTADKVLAGTTFVNGTSDDPIVGTMPNNGAFGEVTLTVTNASVAVAAGYTEGGNVTVKSEAREGGAAVTPTKAEQVIEGADGAFLTKVVVNAIPDKFQDISGVTAAPDKVMEGYTFIDKDGVEQTGTIADNGEVNGSVDGLNTTEVVIPAGYTAGGKVTFDQTAIYDQLAAI
jgi:hypothetical protein